MKSKLGIFILAIIIVVNSLPTSDACSSKNAADTITTTVPPATTTIASSACGDDESSFDQRCCEEAEVALTALSQKVIADGEADSVVKGTFEWTEGEGCALEFPHHAANRVVASLSRDECRQFETCQWSRDSSSCRCYQYELETQNYRGLVMYCKPGKGKCRPRAG